MLSTDINISFPVSLRADQLKHNLFSDNSANVRWYDYVVIDLFFAKLILVEFANCSTSV